MISLLEFIRIDFPALLAALFAAVSSAMIGNFLVLRKQSLLGDALSHAVLPGIVVGFLFSGLSSILVIFLGALIAALLAAFLIEFIHHYGRVERGAAMGVVFSSFFALGVILLEQTGARSADLDPDCVLYGQLEQILWLAPKSLSDLIRWDIWLSLPRQVYILFSVFILLSFFLFLFFKELCLISFDSNYAHVIGMREKLYHMMIMFFTAIVIIASFEAVGSILVIALLICPAAIMRLVTSSYLIQFWGSILLAILMALLGYALAVFVPLWAGFPDSLNIAGSMVMVAGIFLILALFYFLKK